MDVEEFILQYESNQKHILNYFHNLFSSFPEVTSKIRFKVPFYYRKTWICYLNPIKNNGIELCFVRGNELSNSQGLLNSNGRKQVYGISFFSVKEIPEDTIHEIIQEAFILDETTPYASKRKK
jgi:hypothetical protein